MVASGETTLIARAAAWMGRGRAVSAPTHINTTPNGSELPFVRLAFWTRQRPSLQPHSQTSSCPTPSHPTEIPDLSQVAPHLSCSECEKELSSPLPTPSGSSLGPKLCHTNVALPSCAPPSPFLDSLAPLWLRIREGQPLPRGYLTHPRVKGPTPACSEVPGVGTGDS